MIKSPASAITIRLLSGEPIASLDESVLHGDEDVDVILSALETALGTRHWQLFFEGYELCEGVPIAKYGMSHGATVNAVATRKAGIERAVRRLLSSGHSLPTIAEELVLVDVDDASELEVVVSCIWNHIFCDSCNLDAYAEMLTALRGRFPDFQQQNTDEKPMTFLRMLLNRCQSEFEQSLSSFEPAQKDKELIQSLKQEFEADPDAMALQADELDDLSAATHRRKERALVVVKFIGQMFMQDLIALKVIGQIMQDLVGIERIQNERGRPSEDFVELAYELLLIARPRLDSTRQGKILKEGVFCRLRELFRGARGRYSDSIKLKIEGLCGPTPLRHIWKRLHEIFPP